MTCQFCNTMMLEEHYSDSRNTRKWTSFFVCPKCHATLDGEYERVKGQTNVIDEKWWKSENDNSKTTS